MSRIIFALLLTIPLSQTKTIKNFPEVTTRCLKFSDFCRIKKKQEFPSIMRKIKKKGHVRHIKC